MRIRERFGSFWRVAWLVWTGPRGFAFLIGFPLVRLSVWYERPWTKRVKIARR